MNCPTFPTSACPYIECPWLHSMQCLCSIRNWYWDWTLWGTAQVFTLTSLGMCSLHESLHGVYLCLCFVPLWPWITGIVWERLLLSQKLGESHATFFRLGEINRWNPFHRVLLILFCADMQPFLNLMYWAVKKHPFSLEGMMRKCISST